MNLNPAPFNNDEESIDINYKKNIQKAKRNNRTIKKRRNIKNMKVTNFLQSLNNNNMDDSDSDSDENELSFMQNQNQYKQLPKSEIINKRNMKIPSSMKNIKYNPNIFDDNSKNLNTLEKKKMERNKLENEDNDISTQQYNNMNNTSQEFFDNYLPYLQNVSNPQEIHGSKDMLLEKLNYMIHLLEEQQEEKTGHVTEELILYCFLGVFVIFVVDSFAKVGKYVR